MKQCFLLMLSVFAASTLFADEEDDAPVCKKCEVIREENKHKVNPYEFYEDYLKAQQNQPTKTSPNQPK